MYEKTIRLKHHEMAAKIDLSTGELKKLPSKGNNIPSGKLIDSDLTELFKDTHVYYGFKDPDYVM